MTYYCKDLTDPCACAVKYDSLWFMEHRDRAKFVRRPWQCEAAEPDEGVTQVVGVWVDVPINSMKPEADGLYHLRVHRRSFLFAGSVDIADIRDDKSVDDFFALIKDGQEDMAPWGVSYN